MGDLRSCFVLCECVRIIERVIYHVLTWVNMHMEFGVFGADQAAGKFSCGSHTDSCIFRHGFGCRGPLQKLDQVANPLLSVVRVDNCGV
jgi:hypothetical protein